jgi:AcrR family transcriptional regulator
MVAIRPDTRTRIREAAAMLFRRHGYSATGLKRIAAQSGAPFGSIYHFFPGGKQQLAEDTIRTSGPQYMQMVLALLDSLPDPLESLASAFQVAADDLAAPTMPMPARSPPWRWKWPAAMKRCESRPPTCSTSGSRAARSGSPAGCPTWT